MNFDAAELIKRFQQQSVLALTIGREQLMATLVRRDSKTGTVSPPLLVASLKISAEAVLKSPETAGAELAAALKGAGIREKRFVVCVPTEWALTTSADLPDVSPEDLRDYLELRAEREFSSPASEFRLASSVYQLPDGKKRITLAAIPLGNIEAIEQMLRTVGGRALSISLGLPPSSSGPNSGPSACLHFIAAEGKIALMVSTGGGIAALRTLSGPAIRGEAAFDPAAFLREVRITLGRLPEAIVNLPIFGSFQGNQAEVVRNVIEKELEQMGIDPEPVASARPYSSEPGVPAAELFLKNQSLPFEFVILEPNPWLAAIERLNSRRAHQIALAAFAIVALPLLLLLVRIHREHSLQAEWEAMRTSVNDLEFIQQKIRLFRPWFEPMPKNLEILQTLIAVFPEKGDVWTKSIQIKGSAVGEEGTKVICSGFARNQAALMGVIDRLLKTPGVTALSQRTVGANPVQFTATYVWKPKHEQ